MPTHKGIQTLAVCAFFLFVGQGPAFSGISQGSVSQVDPVPPRGPVDSSELEAFIDGVVAAQREALHISGTTIAVVKDGRLFFAKGYGFADIDSGRKVDPAATLFRIGSVSKLFTWTAVMQLAEQGKLDLNRDVNTYLTKFKVPETYPEPVTLTNLLTHTPGFEDAILGLFARSTNSLRPLGDILASDLPARVRPPGSFGSYSNHGTALAGYVVQEVSGVPWEDYIERNILQPLGMAHTTVRQPVPARLAADMSVGYQYRGGEFRPQEFEYVPAMPAGSMSASAIDMTHFMIAHLQQGRFDSAQILSEATARKMHSPLFTPAPGLNPMLYGFYEMSRNGERIYGHGGDTLWFHTQLALFPERNLGLFVSYNSDTGSKARSDLVKAFIDHYFPAPERPKLKALPGFRQRAAQVSGSYVSLRHSYTSLAKIAALVGTASISVTPDGYLRATGMGDQPARWVEVEPFVCQATEGPGKMVFQEKDGRMYLFSNDTPFLTFEKLEGTETPVFQYTVAAGSLLIMLGALIAWPIAAWRRRGHWQLRTGSRAARLVAWVGCLLSLVFAAGLALILRDAREIVFGVPASLLMLLALPLLASVLWILVLAFVVAAWVRQYWSPGGRAYYTLVAAAGLAFTWWLHHWNLLGYHLK